MKNIKLTDYCKMVLKEDQQPDAISAVEISNLKTNEIQTLLTNIFAGKYNDINFYIARYKPDSQRNHFYLLCTGRNNSATGNESPNDKVNPANIHTISCDISSRLNETEKINTPPITIEKLFPYSHSCIYIPILPDENISTYEAEMKLLYLYENYRDIDNIHTKTLKIPGGVPFHFIKSDVGVQRDAACRHSDLSSEEQRYAYEKASDISRKINNDRSNRQYIRNNLPKQNKSIKRKP